MPARRNSRSRPSKAVMAGAKAVAIYRIPAPRRPGPSLDENPLLPFLPKVQRLRYKARLSRMEDPPWGGIFENINWDLLQCPKMVWHPSSRGLCRSTLAHGWRIFRFYFTVLERNSHFAARIIWRRMPSPIRQGWIDAGYVLWGPPSILPFELVLEIGKHEDNVYAILSQIKRASEPSEQVAPTSPASITMLDSVPATPTSVCMASPRLGHSDPAVIEERITSVNVLGLDLGSPVNSPPPVRPSRLASPITSRPKSSYLVRRQNPFPPSASGETGPSTSSGLSRASKRVRKVIDEYDAEASGEDEL